MLAGEQLASRWPPNLCGKLLAQALSRPLNGSPRGRLGPRRVWASRHWGSHAKPHALTISLQSRCKPDPFSGYAHCRAELWSPLGRSPRASPAAYYFCLHAPSQTRIQTLPKFPGDLMTTTFSEAC